MVTNETTKICTTAESKIKSIVKEAKKAFDDRIDAIKNIETMPAIVFQLGQTTPSALMQGGKGELEKDARRFTSEIRDAIKPITEKLTQITKGSAEVEDIMFLVEKLEALAQMTTPLNYNIKKYSISVTTCHSCVADEAKKWREKVEKDPAIRKNILKAKLASNQESLERVTKDLEANKRTLAKCKEEMEGTFARYNDKVFQVLVDLKTEYQRILCAIEVEQKQLVEKAKKRIEANELLVRASAFNRKERTAAYEAAESDYQNTSKKLNQLKADLSNFAKTIFATKYGQIDKQIDELLAQIDKLNNDIATNEVAIESYKNAIEGIKGELNG